MAGAQAGKSRRAGRAQSLCARYCWPATLRPLPQSRNPDQNPQCLQANRRCQMRSLRRSACAEKTLRDCGYTQGYVHLIKAPISKNNILLLKILKTVNYN